MILTNHFRVPNLKLISTFCKGAATTHVYTYTFQNNESKSHCGAVALEIPNITADDIGEIKNLIKEEHEYLLKHEVGISELWFAVLFT